MPDRLGPRHADGHHDASSIARYVIGVMGFDDLEYERNKADMHRRMRTLGVCPAWRCRRSTPATISCTASVRGSRPTSATTY